MHEEKITREIRERNNRGKKMWKVNNKFRDKHTKKELVLFNSEGIKVTNEEACKEI